MNDGTPQVRGMVYGWYTAGSEIRKLGYVGTLNPSYSFTSLTGFSLFGYDPFGSAVTFDDGTISLYGISK